MLAQQCGLLHLELTPDRHQVALFNTGRKKSVISTSIRGEKVDNAIGLDPNASFHAYEFWSDTYLGKLPGTGLVAQTLMPTRCAMVSLRKALPHPQVISTDRHILQGWVELRDVEWNAESRVLSGVAKVIGDEPFKIVIADNGHKAGNATATGAESDLNAHPAAAGLSALTLSSVDNAEVKWELKYK